MEFLNATLEYITSVGEGSITVWKLLVVILLLHAWNLIAALIEKRKLSKRIATIAAQLKKYDAHAPLKPDYEWLKKEYPEHFKNEKQPKEQEENEVDAQAKS